MSFDANWVKKPLVEVTSLIARGITPSYTNEGGIPVINQKCIRDGKVSIEHIKYTDPLKRKVPEEKVIKQHDILVNSTGVGTLGRVAQVKDLSEQCTVDSHVTIVRPSGDVHPVYLGYFLKSQQNVIEAMGEGSTGQTELSRKRLGEELIISLPTIEEQSNISDFLCPIDDKIELNNAINKNLEEMGQALFKRWFIDFEFPNENGEPFKSSGGEFEESELGLIPKGWKVGIATDVFEVASGGTPKTGKTEFWNGDIPFFTPKDSSNSFFVINTEKYITEEGLANCNSKLYPPNTIFITARGTVGKVMLAGCSMAMNQSCYALIAKEGYNQNFAFFLISSLVDILKQNASGAVFDAITVNTFRSLKTVVPPSILTSKFNQLIESIQYKILANVVENDNLTAIRDTLLPKLMSGEVRVPLDEQELVTSD